MNGDPISGRGDPEQKYRIYRLCVCETCEGSGKEYAGCTCGAKTIQPEGHKDDCPVRQGHSRCPDCRGEGKTLHNVANAADPAGVGVAIIQNAEEGMFEGCPLGILEDGGDWLVKPWLPSPRNVSDAARVLAKAKGKK